MTQLGAGANGSAGILVLAVLKSTVGALGRFRPSFRQLGRGRHRALSRSTGSSRRATPTGAFYAREIKPEEPLLTIPSVGRYERGRPGSRTIQASIDGIWEIEPLGDNNRASVPSRMFALGRKASARVRMVDPCNGEELGMWRQESGNPGSPGTFFHIQVLGQAVAPPFPESVSIPRFPGSWVLLPGAVEYVIAELFQDEWEAASMRDSPEINPRRPIQLKRLERQLDWQCAGPASRTGSPWPSAKA